MTQTKTLYGKYNSLREASETTHINIGHISEAANGKRHTAGGYRWKYMKSEKGV